MTASSVVAAAPTAGAAPLRQALLAARPQTLTRLYRQTFPAVRRLVQREGGSAQDAQDVFQDALLVFYEKTVAGTLVLTAAPGTYLVAVSRHLWRREQARRQRYPAAALPPEQAQLLEDEEALLAEATTASVLDYVEQLGERCKSMLLSFYYFRHSLAQIAAAHQYQSVRSATVQKFKCLERLRHSMRGVLADHLAQ